MFKQDTRGRPTAKTECRRFRHPKPNGPGTSPGDKTAPKLDAAPSQAAHARENTNPLVRLLTVKMEQSSKLQNLGLEVAHNEREAETRLKPL